MQNTSEKVDVFFPTEDNLHLPFFLWPGHLGKVKTDHFSWPAERKGKRMELLPVVDEGKASLSEALLWPDVEETILPSSNPLGE